MSVISKTFSFWHRPVRQLTFILISAVACTCAAHAQTPPYAVLQYSTLTGFGNSIAATWVPIVTANGVIYKNLLLSFDVDTSGNLTVSAGYPEVVKAAPILISSFRAGKYVGPSTLYGGQMAIIVSGPSIAPGGATEWSLAAASGASVYTFPDSGTWYVGTMANNPMAARIKAAGIATTAWYFGVGGSHCYCGPDNYSWQANTLLGISQIGTSLTIASFTDANGKDYSEPTDQVTYSLAQ